LVFLPGNHGSFGEFDSGVGTATSPTIAGLAKPPDRAKPDRRHSRRVHVLAKQNQETAFMNNQHQPSTSGTGYHGDPAYSTAMAGAARA
jgi:hypothetical protein